jgi:hypothetical protein
MERTPSMGGWDNFYVIVGSSAAALTGLQFVVITLIGADEAASTTDSSSAGQRFGTKAVAAQK